MVRERRLVAVRRPALRSSLGVVDVAAMWLRVWPTPALAAAADPGNTMQPCESGTLGPSPVAPSGGSDLTHLSVDRSRLDRLTPHRTGGVGLRKQNLSGNSGLTASSPADCRVRRPDLHWYFEPVRDSCLNTRTHRKEEA